MTPFLTSFVRQLQKHFTHTLLSVGGLVTGLVASLLIFLWVLDELSYDHQHPDNSRVFQVMLNSRESNGEIATMDDVPGALAGFLKDEIPEVEEVCRTGYWNRVFFTHGDKSLYFEGRFADSTFFEVFNMPLVAGNPARIMPDDRSIVISRSMALKLFGTEHALDQSVTMNKSTELKVTGIYEDPPRISSLGEEFIMPISYHLVDAPPSWTEPNVSVTVKLRAANDDGRVTEKIRQKMNLEAHVDNTELFLFRMTDWRLHWNFVDGKPSGGRIIYVVSFSLAALFILLMACINYMNLSTARAAIRAREVGVRKMSGASRGALIRQFLMESIALGLIAFVVSVALIYLVLPLFSSLTGKPLRFEQITWTSFLGMFIVALLTGIVAGSYPAFLLSSLKPSVVLKGNLYSGLTGAGLRRTLVVVQFSLSLILLFGVTVVLQQIEYMRTRDLGFDRNRVLYFVPVDDAPLRFEPFKNEVMRSPAIENAAFGAANPMEINGNGNVNWPGRPPGEDVMFYQADCDYDYLPTLGFQLVKGRNFSRDVASDSSNFVITERAAEVLGFDDPIGQTIEFMDKKGEIIGVVKDFHNLDIHELTGPVILSFGSEKNLQDQWRVLFVKYKEGKLTEAMDHLRAVCQQIQPGVPPEFWFLDKDFEYQFQSDLLMGKVAGFFTVFGVFIACLGLFGLTMFSTQRRTREVGIRKVLGASAREIVLLLSRDFSRPLLVAVVVAFPAAWYVAQEFLSAYPYRITLELTTFGMASLSLMGLAMSTVVYLSIKASSRNPVEALRIE